MIAPSRATRLLLVEDDADTAGVLIRLLKESGHEAIHAMGVADAAAIFAQRAKPFKIERLRQTISEMTVRALAA